MRVLVLTPYLYGTTPGPRSSFELWERVLSEAGITLEYAAFETQRLHDVLYGRGQLPRKALEMARAYAAFLPKLNGLADYDAVLVNREAALVGPALIERYVVRRGKPLIYWIDDPLYIPYRSQSNGLLSYVKFFGKVKTICRISTLVMTNAPSHTAFARRYNSNVREIPSLVDADLYTGWAPRATNGSVCVGWSGSPTSSVNLQLIREPLRTIGRRDDVELRFIGAGNFDFAGIRHSAQPWRADTEITDLRRFDVGMLPLIEHQWAPHKFYLKLVQYMALGIPPVATPVGANTTVIDDGESGFLVGDHAEWIETIGRLVEDPETRERVGRRAAEVAHQRYTLQANAERIVAAFRSALPTR